MKKYLNLKNNDDLHSCETPIKKNYSIQTTSTKNHYAQHISALSVILLHLNTPTNLPPVGLKKMCFHIDDKYAHAAKCVKSRILTKVVDCVLFIGKFEQQCVVLKGILQAPSLKYHMNTFGIDQSLINSILFEHRCLQNINKIHKHYGKCEKQEQFKDILKAAMVSTPKGFTYNTFRSPMTTPTLKKPSARKLLCFSLTY